jgi:hypothetical protein
VTADVDALRHRLETCPAGQAGWREFEDVSRDILTHLFVPPLREPVIQPRSYSGIDRRDVIFPNRNPPGAGNWGLLRHDLDARLVLVEFKNYDSTDIGKDETNQIRNYLTAAMGRLAILCCNKTPVESAFIKRKSIYSEERKVIIFLTPDDMVEMLHIQDRGEDPSDLIVDLIDQFYLQYE